MSQRRIKKRPREQNDVKLEPPLVYRFLEREHIDKFQNDGQLRLCPLTKYREIGGIRQDGQEGFTPHHISGPGKLSPAEAKLAFGLDNTITIGHRASFVSNLHYPNAYLFCTSLEANSAVQQRFGTDFFTITNLQLFGESIVRALSNRLAVTNVLRGNVDYVRTKEKRLSTAEVINDPSLVNTAYWENYFRKENSYAIEAEYRFLFMVEPSDDLVPIFLQLTQEEIRASCRF